MSLVSNHLQQGAQTDCLQLLLLVQVHLFHHTHDKPQAAETPAQLYLSHHHHHTVVTTHSNAQPKPAVTAPCSRHCCPSCCCRRCCSCHCWCLVVPHSITQAKRKRRSSSVSLPSASASRPGGGGGGTAHTQHTIYFCCIYPT